MVVYRTPGVYFEWPDTRVPALRPLRTDVAGFVGIAAAGPLHTPVRIESMTQFTSIFGGHTPQGYLAYAVEGFFANGGETCWIVRVADPSSASPAIADLLDENKRTTLRLTAISHIVTSDGQHHVYKNPGTAGRRISYSLALTAQNRFTLTVRLGNTREIWRDLSVNPGDRRNVKRMLNAGRDEDTPPEEGGDDGSRLRGDGSRLVRVTDPFSSADTPRMTPDPRALNQRGGFGWLEGGNDGLKYLSINHFSGEGSPEGKPWGLAALEVIDEISVVAMPDIMPKAFIEPPKPKKPPRDCSKLPRDCDEPDADPGPPPASEAPLVFPPGFSREEVSILQSALVAHCLKLKDRFAVLDTRPEDLTSEAVLEWRRRELSGDDQSMRYAALYFPWLLAPDPLRLEGQLRAVPPSGHVAGIYARGDRRVGVHKPPANEELESVKDVRVALDDETHGDLNEQGVNAIRAYPGRGIRVAGARTLCLKDPSWRYINVRRLVTMIEEAIDEGTQWTVFEPNNPALWREIDRVARNFLQGIWRRGMLDGETPEEAYSVRCDESTNPASETDNGRVTCELGLQPPWPAEFIRVLIGKTEQGSEFFETAGAGDA